MQRYLRDFAGLGQWGVGLHLLQKIFSSLKTLQTALPNILISAASYQAVAGVIRTGSAILPSDETITTRVPDVVRKKVAAVLLPVLAAVASLAVSWQRWINPFVDSGRELDVPWRLAQGERLYRDITYYYGPLGPWVNALALRLFGNRWLVLETVCGALSVLIFWLLFRITRRAGSLLSATVAVTLAAALCMGAPRGGAFIFPYSSSSLFALAGCLLAIAAAGEPRRRWLIAIGVAIALASRVEVGAAACGIVLLAALRSRDRREARVEAAMVALGAFAAGGIYGIACAGVSWKILLSDGPFSPFVAMPQEWRDLYLQVSGLDDPVKTAGRIAVSLLLGGVLLAAAARVRRDVFTIAGLLLLVLAVGNPWKDTACNLPPVLAVLPTVAGMAALFLLRRPLEERDRARFLLFAGSAALALRVLFGLSVGARMSPYSAVALPGLLATGAVLVFDLLAPRFAAPRVFRVRMAVVFAAFGVLFLYRVGMADNGPHTVALQTAAGTLRLPSQEAAAIGQTLRYLERNARAGETLAAFPEGGFFNFVLRLRSPLRQDLIVPGVLSGEREDAVVRQVEVSGPRYVLLCNRPTPEYGPVAFGRDYAARLWSEVESRYVLTRSFGWARPSAPVGARRFFIRLYERSPELATASLDVSPSTANSAAAAAGPARSVDPAWR